MKFVALNEIDEALGPLGHTGVWMIHFCRCIPQNVKFEVGWLASVDFLESFHTRLHDVSGGSQRGSRILWIATWPNLRANLKTRYFPVGTYRTVVVTGFKH